MREINKDRERERCKRQNRERMNEIKREWGIREEDRERMNQREKERGI